MLGISTLGLPSCSDDNPLVPEITVPEGTDNLFGENIVFSSSSNQKQITFTSNVDWTISVAQTRNGTEWLSVNPSFGHAGKNTVNINVSENSEYDDRSVVMKIQAGTLEKYINFTQKQKNALTLSSNKFELTPEGGDIKVEVKANTNYDVVIPSECQKWIKQETKSRGLVSNHLHFSIAKSEEYDKREGTIIVKAGDLSETIHIYQSGEAVLLLSKNEFTTSQKGGEFKVEVKSNFDFAVQMPDVPWIKESKLSRACSSHSLYYVVSPNDTYDNRTATITYYDRNSDLAEDVVITQTQSNAIIIAAKNYDIMPNGGRLSIAVDSNIPYEMKLPNETWIHKFIKTRGLNKSHEVITIDANYTSSERTAHILFENKEYELQEIVSIKQRCQDVKDFRVRLDYAGTLEEQIPSELKNKITKLTIEGPLNGSDIRYLREMAGRDVNNNVTEGVLKILNMRYANIVEGGDAYYLHYYDSGSIDSHTTINDKFGAFFFQGCHITEIIIPESVDAICGSAFSECQNLSKVELNNNITNILAFAFQNCKRLRSINIPNSVTKISYSAFSGSGLTEINFPSNLQELGEYVFSYSEALTKVNLPSTITDIPRGCFWGCTALETIDIPSNIGWIFDNAFTNCTKLKSINLSEGLISIRNKAFSNCSSLNDVTLPLSLDRLDFPFSGCSSLNKITCKSPYPPTLSLISDNSHAITVYVPCGSYNRYATAEGWRYCNIVEME